MVRTSVSKPPVVVCVGEALFDCFDDRQILGGAPVNLAVHAHQLLSLVNGRATVISRVGHDELGVRVTAELTSRGVATENIQRDEQHATGTVSVQLCKDGQPNYAIEENAAWDHIELPNEVRRLLDECSAVCFGTLVQRSSTSRETIQSILRAAPHAIRIFDINLRQSYFSKQIIADSLRLATATKLNDEELPQVCEMFGVAGNHAPEQAKELMTTFDLDWVAITRGAKGTALYTKTGSAEGEPVTANTMNGADSVGAGDACCAGLVVGHLMNWSPQQIADFANQLGAYVAGQAGATPTLPESITSMMRPNAQTTAKQQESVA